MYSNHSETPENSPAPPPDIADYRRGRRSGTGPNPAFSAPSVPRAREGDEKPVRRYHWVTAPAGAGPITPGLTLAERRANWAADERMPWPPFAAEERTGSPLGEALRGVKLWF